VWYEQIMFRVPRCGKVWNEWSVPDMQLRSRRVIRDLRFRESAATRARQPLDGLFNWNQQVFIEGFR